MKNLFGEPLDNKPYRKPIDKVKRNWENQFQKWSNDQGTDELTSTGICGYSNICEYCTDCSKGRPCVRALNSLLREKNIVLDYTNAKFIDVWNTKFLKKEGI